MAGEARTGIPSDTRDAGAGGAVGREITFGPFRLQPERHVLLRGDRRVPIGGRAFDILLVLIERAGDVVTKDDLVSRVWPNLVVSDSNLRNQVTQLRKLLGDDGAASRYVVTIAGRGYCFAAPVSVTPATTAPHAAPVTQPPAPAPTAPAQTASRVPRPLSRVIGRADAVAAIATRLERRRFITIVGPGGIGKTTVALATVHAQAGSYADGVCFVDLAPVAGSVAISSVVASALGLAVVTQDPTAELIAFLRNRRLLLLLDSCEHVLDEAGLLAEAMLRGAPRLHVLATSREALRAEGESVYALAPLATPPAAALSAAEALTFAAVELFAERASASLGQFEVTDGNAAVVSSICRKLDGMALAIELAAGRVETFGVDGLAAQLDDRFRLLMQGRRTALPRHRTLGAALDWSHEFLDDAERTVLRRLAVFVGGFSLEAAAAVALDPGDGGDIAEVVANLAAKSLLAVTLTSDAASYRLLDTTRAYAGEKLAQSGELGQTSRRHAAHYRAVLQRAGVDAETKPRDAWLATYGGQIDNVRKALDWALSPDGDATLGIALTVVALPLWMHFSLMEECRSRVAQALSRLPTGPDRDAHLEMQLSHALGAVLLNIEASGAEMETALRNALVIAETLDDVDYRLRVLWCLWCHALNRGAFREALDLADAFTALAKRSADPVDPLTGERMRGFVFHFLGDQAEARRLIEYMMARYIAPVHRAHIIRFQFDQMITARNFLIQVLWLQGFVDQAARMNAANVEEALAFDHTMTLCNALTKCACRVALLAGDLGAADRFITLLRARAARDGLPMWHAWGDCFRAVLLIKQGAVGDGLDLLRTTLAGLPENRFSLRTVWVLGEYAAGLRLGGLIDEGLRVIDRALALAERDEELWCLAELLRIKADLVTAAGGAAADDRAERLFLRSLEVAASQRARSWQLRTAIGLGRLYQRQGRPADARQCLVSAYDRFAEGFDTPDLRAAKALIDACA